MKKICCLIPMVHISGYTVILPASTMVDFPHITHQNIITISSRMQNVTYTDDIIQSGCQ